jgi:pseudaminic acid synthase
MTKTISIDGRVIGANCPPYIIAELSANHNGDIERAFKIMEAAKQAGADAMKLQTYRADTITIDHDSEDFQIHGGLWDGRTLFELYEWAQMPWDWHEPMFSYAKELELTIFSSPFDKTAVDLLEKLNAPAYKIASFEAIDLPLISYVASTGKPMIISTGMANLEEIGEAIATARDSGCNTPVVLHCVSGYPAPAADYNLKTMADIAARFDVIPGLSDHTIDNVTALASVALGGCVIEKHVTLDRSAGGPDDSFSLEPDELASLVQQSRVTWESLGHASYELQPSEKENTKFRRSLYVVKDLHKGEVITHEHVRSIRPGFGLAPKYLDQIVGQVALHSVSYGTPVGWSLVR